MRVPGVPFLARVADDLDGARRGGALALGQLRRVAQAGVGAAGLDPGGERLILRPPDLGVDEGGALVVVLLADRDLKIGRMQRSKICHGAVSSAALALPAPAITRPPIRAASRVHCPTQLKVSPSSGRW